MESFSKSFTGKVRRAFDRKDIRILATIPVKHSLPLVKEIQSSDDSLLIELKMIRNKGFIVLIYLSSSAWATTNSDIDTFQLHNLTASNHKTTFTDIGFPKPHYIHSPQEYMRNLENLLSTSQGNFQPFHEKSATFPADYSDHRAVSSQNAPLIHIYKVAPHQDRHRQYDDWNLNKKHDFRGGQNYGGWDSFPQSWNWGDHGSDNAGGIFKKGKEAKALFLLITPLLFLAVFGPILATQAMLPWMFGGINTVSTIAGGRRKRHVRQNLGGSAEMQRRLHLFLELQDFIARTGSQGLVEEMGEAFMRCQRFTGRRNKCLERAACEYTDRASVVDPEERRIGRMVLQNVMSNPLIPSSLREKLNKGFLTGKNEAGHCKSFWCHIVDSNKHFL